MTTGWGVAVTGNENKTKQKKYFKENCMNREKGERTNSIRKC